jgi:glycosyltransferase involved in cell wall biosynthesis
MEDFASLGKIVVAHITTYPPRSCGIASFTKSLVETMAFDRFAHQVLAVDDGKPRYQYDQNVKYVIDANNSTAFVDAAKFLNQSKSSVVSLQHEYGIFGRDWGKNVLGLSSSLQKPLVTTFHTVLRKPPQLARIILLELASASRYVVVTLKKAAQLLANVYNVPENKLRVIAHGAPATVRHDPSIEKSRLGLSGKQILTTVGFLSPAKGIEYGIEAVKMLVKSYPHILYLIVGETHPTLKRERGEQYRRKLETMVEDLNLTQHVMFVNRYVSDEELATFLDISDVYLAPYRGRDQVSSGTLTHAMASGKAIVTTPTPFAKETFILGRGLRCEFDNSKSIARQVHRILSDPSLKQKLEARARNYGKQVGWQQAAEKYAKIFFKAAERET